MLTGIIVFDSDFRIEQLNERASLLLGSSDNQKLLALHDSLEQVAELLPYYHDWKANPQRQLPTFLTKIPISHCRLALVKFGVTGLWIRFYFLKMLELFHNMLSSSKTALWGR
jgi:PAS domain-containing protein